MHLNVELSRRLLIEPPRSSSTAPRRCSSRLTSVAVIASPALVVVIAHGHEGYLHPRLSGIQPDSVLSRRLDTVGIDQLLAGGGFAVERHR